jgi:alpha-L-rhamnosidase
MSNYKNLPEKWLGKWVVPSFVNKPTKKGTPATYFQKAFTINNEIKTAMIYATCHGVYHLYINGKRPDDREFAPEFTVYEKMLYVQAYDVTAFMQLGENLLSITVGDGWYAGSTTKQTHPGWDFRHACLWQLEIVYTDGTQEIIGSDTNTNAANGIIIQSDLFHGEKVDANETSQWQPSIIADFGYDNLVLQTDEPVRPVLTIPVKEILKTPKGETVLDFGQNIAGRLRVTLNLPLGSTATFEHSETLDKNGNYFNNIMGINQLDSYTSNGEPTVFEPAFTFHGFRYVRINGIPNPQKDDFSAIVLSTDAKWLGTFSCSDEKINRLVENTVWSQRSNMLSVPSDCPQREKMGWTGDMTVYAKTALMNQDLTGLFSRWLESLAITQLPDGQVPNVVPLPNFYRKVSKLTNILLGGSFKHIASSGWGDAAVIVPWEMYQATGNSAVLEKQYRSMKAWVEYMRHEAAENRSKKSKLPEDVEKYLWNTGFHFGEWLIPSATEHGSMSAAVRKSAKAGRDYIAPVYFFISTKILSETAFILDKKEDADFYTDLAEKIKLAYQKSMVCPDGTLKVDVQGAYALALGAGLIPEEYKVKAANRLAFLIHRNGDRLDTGFLATPYLLDALSDNGHIDLAYTLLYQEQRPSWMYQLEKGATTIWENWNSENDVGDVQKISMNHYAFGCVADWIYRKVGGITRTGVGYKRFIIQPQPDRRLTWAKRKYESPYGYILCDWKREKNIFSLYVEIPCGTEATVVLPDGQQYEVGGGVYDYECEIIPSI